MESLGNKKKNHNFPSSYKCILKKYLFREAILLYSKIKLEFFCILKFPSYLIQELAFYSYFSSLGLQITLSLICFPLSEIKGIKIAQTLGGLWGH